MRKYLARNHKFYIQELENWIQISGIASWSVSYTSDVSDLSKFNDNGWSSSIVTGRSGSITLEGFYLVDSTTGVIDHGQNLCNVASNSLGYYNLKQFKIQAFDDNFNIIGSILASGIFKSTIKTGNTTSLLPWSVTITFKSIPTGFGIYNIFSQETYPTPAPDISRSGMWTGVLGMYTYAE